jgi:hypothetical protein
MSEQTLESWKAAMLSGHFAVAWQISDRYLASEEVRSTAPGLSGSPLWRGEPLGGKRILVRCHHGLGDTIQFIRFAAPLRRIARSVTVYSQPELVPIVATVPGVDRVLALGCGIDDAAFDLQIEVMELAHALRVDACGIRRSSPHHGRGTSVWSGAPANGAAAARFRPPCSPVWPRCPMFDCARCNAAPPRRMLR